MGMRSATHQVRTTITRCRIILCYQHNAKGLLVCFKKGYQGSKRRLAFKMCAKAAQDTIHNRYGFRQNFVHNPQTLANIAMHMSLLCPFAKVIS
jgi:hypothetical protein